MQSLKNFTVTTCLILLFASPSYSFDSDKVHPSINEKALQPGNSIIDQRLKDIGLNGGVHEVLANNEEVLYWLKKGGTDEDSPVSRTLNHFHDPTQPWAEAELWGWLGTSSVIWAQMEKNTANWSKARESYLQALRTGSGNDFVTAFKNLGQLMHLVSDKAVPAHVRDDAHMENMFADVIPITHFEVWSKTHVDAKNYSAVSPDRTIFSMAKFVDSYVPITALWDIDRYTDDPSITLGSTPLIGLAEYTNANFFSEGTIFSSQYMHPAEEDTNFPDIDWENPVAIDAEDGKIDKKIYLHRKTGDPNQDFRLAAAGYHLLDEYESNIPIRSLILDETIFQDYADRLIPRAVGYSSALLDYFFRGRIDMKPNNSGDGTYILHNESDEPITDGYFSLYYDDENDVRHQVGDTWGPFDIPVEGESPPVTFKPPTNPKTPGEYMLVFNGILGQEQGAVAGKIVFNTPEVIVVALGSYVFVWDTETDDYAEINDSTGLQIQFPCLKSDLQDWLANHPPQQVDHYQWMNTGINLANITIVNTYDRVRPDTSDCDTIYCNNFLVGFTNYDDIAYADYPALLSYSNYSHVLSDNSGSDIITMTGIYMTELTGEFSLNNYEESYSHNLAGSDIVDNSVFFGSYNSGASGQIILENSHIKQNLFEVQWQNTAITPQALAQTSEQGHKDIREEDVWSVNSWLGPLAEFTVGLTTNSDWSVSCYGPLVGLGGYACPDTIQARTSIETTISLYDDTVFNPKYLTGLSTAKTIVHIIAYQYRLKKTETTTDSQGTILNSNEVTLDPEFNVQAAFGSFADSSQIDPFDITEVPLRVKLSDAVKELIETHYDNSIVPNGGLVSIDQIETTINPL